MEIYSLPVLVARCPKSRCRLGPGLQGRVQSLLCWLLVAVGSPCVPWFVGSHSSPCLQLHMAPLSVCLHIIFLLCLGLFSRGTQVSLDWGPTLTQCDLILTHYICKDSISK